MNISGEQQKTTWQGEESGLLPWIEYEGNDGDEKGKSNTIRVDIDKALLGHHRPKRLSVIIQNQYYQNRPILLPSHPYRLYPIRIEFRLLLLLLSQFH